jgi:hypothetical protein
MRGSAAGGSVSLERRSRVEARGRGLIGAWYIVYPARDGEGMDTARGPFQTRWGARLSRWLWG